MTKHEIIEKIMAAKEKLAGRKQKALQAPASPPAPAEEGRPLPLRWKDWLLRHKRLCVSAMALCLAGAVGLRMVLNGPAETASGYQYIRTTTLQKTSLENSVTATGTVASASTANVTVPEGAQAYMVASVNVEVGDEVKLGDVIATLDTSDLEEQIADAQLSYSDDVASAQTSYDRAQLSYENALDQYYDQLKRLADDVDDAEEDLDDAEDALSEAKALRTAAQALVNSAQSEVNALQSVYDAIQSISDYVDSYDDAADALATAVSALDRAGDNYTDAYMDYTSASSEEKEEMLAELKAAAEALESAWEDYGSGAGMSEALSINEDVSSSNRRTLAETDAPSISSVNAQLAAADSGLTLREPSSDTLVDNFITAANALVAQESAASSGSGMTYQEAIEKYEAAQSQLSEAQSALEQAEEQVSSAADQVENSEDQVESADDSYDEQKDTSSLTSYEQQIEDAASQLEKAQRTPDNLFTLLDTLDDCTLTATMDGTVTSLNATVGSACGESVVATIQDVNDLVVEITLTADTVRDISIGMPCTIQSDATGETEINGTLTQIDPTANEQGTFGAKVQVNTADSGLLIGIQAQVEIIRDVTEGVFVVPIDAVGTAQDGSSFVYRQTGGEGVDMTFEEVPVTTGASNDYYIEITGDSLAEGDVIRSSADLTEGLETSDEEDSSTSASGMGGMGGGGMGGGGMGGGAPAGGPGGR